MWVCPATLSLLVLDGHLCLDVRDIWGCRVVSPRMSQECVESVTALRRSEHADDAEVAVAAVGEGGHVPQTDSPAVSLQQLRTSRGSDLRRMLVNLHVSWGHASARYMRCTPGKYPGLPGEITSLCVNLLFGTVLCVVL